MGSRSTGSLFLNLECRCLTEDNDSSDSMFMPYLRRQERKTWMVLLYNIYAGMQIRDSFIRVNDISEQRRQGSKRFDLLESWFAWISWFKYYLPVFMKIKFCTENFPLARLAIDFLKKITLANRIFHSTGRVRRVLFASLFVYKYTRHYNIDNINIKMNILCIFMYFEVRLLLYYNQYTTQKLFLFYKYKMYEYALQ